MTRRPKRPYRGAGREWLEAQARLLLARIEASRGAGRGPTRPLTAPMMRPGVPAAPYGRRAGLVVRRLGAVVLYGKPRRAIAAFRALTALCKFYRDAHARMVELSRTGRPAIAAAAVSALVEMRLAHRRYRDGRSPLNRL